MGWGGWGGGGHLPFALHINRSRDWANLNLYGWTYTCFNGVSLCFTRKSQCSSGVHCSCNAAFVTAREKTVEGWVFVLGKTIEGGGS
jgi:hypothetical protein